MIMFVMILIMNSSVFIINDVVIDCYSLFFSALFILLYIGRLGVILFLLFFNKTKQ